MSSAPINEPVLSGPSVASAASGPSQAGSAQDSTAALRRGLERFLSARCGAAVTVSDLSVITSVGNAREPWSFAASWNGRSVHCVMLVKAAAGQLETDLGPEFATIAACAGSGVPVAPALWIDEEGEAFGRPFFVTEWVPGSADTRPLRRDDDPAVRSTALDLAAAAARLHNLDIAPFGHLPATTVEAAAATQLAYWADGFERQRLEAHPALAWVLRWLAAAPPTARRVSVVHGDLRFGNLLAQDGRVTALLDWEMCHLGDPVEDLGWVYRELWSPARSLPFDAFLDAYREGGGPPFDADQLRWYRVFNEFKHAVISLTGTRSFVEGRTANLRMADRAATVDVFARRALELARAC